MSSIEIETCDNNHVPNTIALTPQQRPGIDPTIDTYVLNQSVRACSLSSDIFTIELCPSYACVAIDSVRFGRI